MQQLIEEQKKENTIVFQQYAFENIKAFLTRHNPSIQP
jgi:hypothetical protein